MSDKNIPRLRFPEFTDEWEQRKLGEICQVTMGQSPDGSTYSEEPSDYILVQGNADLKDGWVIPRIWTTQKTKTAQAGDLIMSVRAPAGAMGKTAYDVVLGRGVAGIKGNEFVYQLLVKMDSNGYWKKMAAGSTFESVNSDVVNNAEITIPQDMEEQEKIGAYFDNLDHLITLHQRKCNSLKELRNGVIQRILSKELRFRRADGSEFKNWVIKELAEIFTERKVSQTITEDAPLLSFTIEQGVINPQDKKTNKRDFLIKDKKAKKFALTEVDDIIYNPANLKYGAIHRNKLMRGVVSPIYAIFYTEQNSAFMEYVVKNPTFIKNSMKYLEGTVIKLMTLKPKDFLKLKVEIPASLEEQKIIADFLMQFDKTIDAEQRKIEKWKELKKGLIQQMFI